MCMGQECVFRNYTAGCIRCMIELRCVTMNNANSKKFSSKKISSKKSENYQNTNTINEVVHASTINANKL